jgi:peptide/nickel transport system ATP-binding protein
MRTILEVKHLSTRYFTESGQVNAVEDLSLTVRESEVYGIVGESGSGKSVTARSVMGLIESPGRITEGEIWFRDADLSQRVSEFDQSAVDGDLVDLRQVDVRDDISGSFEEFQSDDYSGGTDRRGR